MRQKRVKSYRKVMQMYQSSFKFREPYQLLVDTEFVKAIVAQKLELQARLTDVLQGALKPSKSCLSHASYMITQCCIQALYDLGPSGQPCVDLAKEFERRKCNHLKARPGVECLTAMAGKDNPHRYVIATQSLDLRKHLRTVPGLPIVYLNRSVVLLESPSAETIKKKLQMENAKRHVPSIELATLAAQGSIPTASNSTSLIDSYNSSNFIGGSTEASTSALVEDAEKNEDSPQKKKKKGPKGPSGPNPLSVKKKKKVSPNTNINTKSTTSESANANRKRARSDDDSTTLKESMSSGYDRKKRRAENEALVVMSSSKRGAERGVAVVRLPSGKDVGVEGGSGGGAKRKRKRKRGSGGGTGAGTGSGSGEQMEGGDT
ncbi:BQ2448_3299 [Microbotryum intermedium]|uniref:U three protein 23 n=1 Tax=Microbotryum intermedium TaxID=269621 RepID=A0A238FHV2_9BASI|nr:BQ2448_3299 [Microbotryum intermedium]